MSGGNKNIRPEDGKQFSAEYQPQEKWTEREAIDIVNSLLDWLEEKDADGNDSGNIFLEDFEAERRISDWVPSYLSKKFTSFSKLYEIAKKKSKAKLLKYGCADRLNATMAKFCLMNHHGYSDKSQAEVKQDNTMRIIWDERTESGDNADKETEAGA